MVTKRQLLCVILDGWGYRAEKKHNAIEASRKPVFDWLWNEYPRTLLEASGEAVGLPKGQIGNSEIGHMTIGAGRPIDTDLVRIGKALKKRELKINPALLGVINHVLRHKSALHIMGIFSYGGVHGHEDHWFELIKTAKDLGVTNIILHPFSDGRDTPPQVAADSLKKLEDFIQTLGLGFIASISGRYYAMDRDKNWERTEKAKRAIFEHVADIESSAKPSETLRALYAEGSIDELLEPIVFKHHDVPPKIRTHDGIIFTNFRADRVRQLIAKTIELIDPLDLKIVTMTEYEPTYPVSVMFSPFKLATALNKEIAKAGLTQAHIAETEKYPHVTYFINGGEERPAAGERHILIESRKDIKTHDEAPLMRAKEIADAAINGKKHKKISVFFESFVRSGSGVAVASGQNGSSVISDIRNSLESLGLSMKEAVLSVKRFIADTADIQKLKLGNQEAPSGFTIYDKDTREPYCMEMRSGRLIPIAGECGETEIQSVSIPPVTYAPVQVETQTSQNAQVLEESEAAQIEKSIEETQTEEVISEIKEEATVKEELSTESETPKETSVLE